MVTKTPPPHQGLAEPQSLIPKHAWLILAFLCLLAYLPALTQPLIEDDWPNIAQARLYGPPQGWPALAADSTFRFRSTGYVWLAAIDRLAPVSAPAFYAGALLLHILNVWLLFSVGRRWPLVGPSLSFWAAAFFAVYEGHQEAVMWVSACNELLQFLFGLAAIYCLLRWNEDQDLRWYIASLFSLVLALISKESAVIFAGLLPLVVLTQDRSLRRWPYLLPFAALAAGVAFSISTTRESSFRFHDGSFSWQAPFWRTLPESMVRMFWFWGLLALIAIALWGWARYRTLVMVALAWIAVGLLPYSFVTYTTRVPSRQTYLASAGLAWIVGGALVLLRDRHRRLLPAVAVLLVLHNVGYLWTRKRQQFLRRAAPTEQLLTLARRDRTAIYVACFPRPRIVAEEAVRLGAGRPPESLAWTREEANARNAATVFCYHE